MTEMRQQDYGFRRFLDEDGHNYRISQRTSNGLTVVELAALSHPQGIITSGIGAEDNYVVFSGETLVGTKTEIPGKSRRRPRLRDQIPSAFHAVLLDEFIRTYAVQRDQVSVTIREGYPTRKSSIFSRGTDFRDILSGGSSDAQYVDVTYFVGNDKPLNYVSFNNPRYFHCKFYFYPEEDPFPYHSMGDRGDVSLSRSSGTITAAIESQDDIVKLYFPEKLDEKTVSELEALLTTDMGWLELQRVKPILQYERISK